MNKLLISIFFIAFSQQAMATTIEAELAKPKSYNYESMDYRHNLLSLKNSESWCYKYKDVERCRPVIGQIISSNGTNFVINDKYRIDVKYDDLKKNKSCEQGNTSVKRVSENLPFDLRRKFFCIEDNNLIHYTFKYFPDIQGIGLETMFYGTCSSQDFEEYTIPLLRKFNSFTQSQSPRINLHPQVSNLALDSPLTGEHFYARLENTKDAAIKCKGDSALTIAISLEEYRQNGTRSFRVLYESFIKKLMEMNAKENKPIF